MQIEASDKAKPVEGVEPLRSSGAKGEHGGNGPAGHTDAPGGVGRAPPQWERTFDAAGDAIFLTDRQFRIARANRATSQLLGKPLGEILGKTYWQAIHGTDQPPETSPLTQAHHTKTHVQGEIYVSQRAVWLEVSVDPMLDENGDVTGVLHILRDVTEGKKAKEAMRESEEKYRNLFENAWEAIVLTDLNGTITGVNRLVEDYGFQREELIGKRLFDFVAEDHRTRALADFKVLLGGKPAKGEMEVLTPKGVVCVEYRDNPILRGGQVVGVQAILTDVTKRKRAEQLLRAERDRVQKYLDIAGVMLVVIDTEERVGLINKKGCEILGCAEEDVLGKNWFDNFLPAHLREHIRAVFAGLMAGRIHPNEYVENFVLTRTGQERLMAWHNTVLRDETGQIVGTLGSGEDLTERRRAEEAYRSLVDHSLLGLVIFQDGKAVFANQAMAEITGYAIDEILAMSAEEVRDFVHPEDREIVWQNYRRHLAGEPAPEHYEMRGIRKDGLVCWLEIDASRIDYRGQPAIQAAYIDRTKRKHAEEMLRLSEDKYRGIFENAVLGMYQTTPDGEILAANPALVRMLGYGTLDELASRNLEEGGFELEHPRSLFKERIEAEGQIVGLESAWKRRDGSTLWVRESARVTRDEAGKTLFYEGTVEDITECKRAEEALRNREGMLQKIFDILPVGLWFSDKDGKLLRGNPAGVKIWGVEPKVSPSEYGVFQARRLPSGEEVAPEDWALAHSIREGVTIVDELLEIEAFDGKKKTILNYTAPVLDDQGNVQGAIVVNQDITERRRAEQQLLGYQSRLRELAAELTLAEERERRRIAVGVHDQIGQPLAMIKLALQSLERSARATDTLQAVKTACQEIDRVIEDAHSLTFELSNPILYEVGFEPAVESWLLHEVRGRHGLECAFEADRSSMGLTKETRVVLFNIVRELLANVVKHAKAKHVDVRIQQAGDQTQITVQDDGIGFEPSNAGMPDPRSGGYGLFSIRERLEVLGGNLKIESAPGAGTCISLAVPLQPGENQEQRRHHHEDSDCG